MENPLMLIINPGGTTTKVAIYKGDEALYKDNVEHSLEEMKKYKTVWEQYDLRRRDITQYVKERGYNLEDFDAFVSRCGASKPSSPGIYVINENMVADFKTEKYGTHPCSPGCYLTYDLGREFNKPALTVDPNVSNEMMKTAEYSGHPECVRRASFHVLNQKAIGRFAAEQLGKSYQDIDIIVAHIGSGISVGAHAKGKVIDVNNGLEGDGPFSPVRTGALPVGDLIEMCFSGKYTRQEMHKQVNGEGGLAAYLGTSDGREIEERIKNGDEEAKNVVEAMAYQVAKEIGARAVTLKGKVDAIAITGGIANWSRVTELVKDWVKHIAPIYVYPGENELESLAAGALRYLREEEKAQTY